MLRVKDPDRLAYVISLYHARGRKISQNERQYFAELLSFEDVVRIAGEGNIRDNERHEHLVKIDAVALTTFRDRLLVSTADLLRCRSFDELYEVLWSKRISGIGQVTIYDTAISIGSWWDEWLEPDVVYLHAGTAKGAYALGVRPGTDKIQVEDLPEAFHEYTPAEAEDILCEYYKKRSEDFARYAENRRNR
jgi:hypothetical protein